MFKKSYLFFFGLIFWFALGCCGNRLMFSSYMNPEKKVIDLNKEIQERCVLIQSENFGKYYHLSIVSSKGIKFSTEEVVKSYEKIMETVDSLSSRKFPKQEFQLTLIDFEKKPDNYIFNAPNAKSQENTLIILEGNLESDRTNEVICQLEQWGPHEFFHHSVSGLYPGVKSGILNGAGWFEEGLACYCNYLSDFNFSECKEKVTHSDPKKAKDAFLNDEIRQRLWKNFSPGNESWKNRKRLKKMTGNEIKAFWKPIDEGYDASLGAFLFIEEKIGRGNLFDVVHKLQGKYDYQDEEFYKDLTSKLGFDIRKIRSEDIERTFNMPSNTKE